jgi:carbonic anhydrase
VDLGIGDIFNSRVAGNVENADILGSMEFACKLAGAKVVLVMGHTRAARVRVRSITSNLERSHPDLNRDLGIRHGPDL